MIYNGKAFSLWAILFCVVLFVSGCGNETLTDKFVFGKNRISCANATITVTTPFELISEGEQVESKDRSDTRISAEGHNKNLQMIITAKQIEGNETAELLTNEAKAVLQGDSYVTDLKTEESHVKIGTEDGRKLVFVFDETVNSKKTNLTVTEYIFEYEGVLWRVIYQYRSIDETGRQLTELIAGKIYLGTTF